MSTTSKAQSLNPFNLGSASVRNSLAAFANGEILSAGHLSNLVCGSNLKTNVINLQTGRNRGSVPITDLDLAATKPLFVPVLETAMHLQASFRHNTGRSNGVKPEVMTQALEDSREIIGKFFGIDPDRHVVIFRERTSIGMPGLIKIAARDHNHMFMLSLASHHSAQLPARIEGRYQFFGLKPNGTYDMDDLETRLKAAGKYYHPYIVIESETNMTGYKPPVAEVCALAEKYGAKVFIDHAQGAANHRLSLKDLPGDVFLAITPDASLQRLPGILKKIRGLSYKNSVIKPDFESGIWYVDGGQNDSKANAHSRFDLSVRGPYSKWARKILKDFT